MVMALIHLLAGLIARYWQFVALLITFGGCAIASIGLWYYWSIHYSF